MNVLSGVKPPSGMSSRSLAVSLRLTSRYPRIHRAVGLSRRQPGYLWMRLSMLVRREVGAGQVHLHIVARRSRRCDAALQQAPHDGIMTRTCSVVFQPGTMHEMPPRTNSHVHAGLRGRPRLSDHNLVGDEFV